MALLTGNYISITDGVLWRGTYHGQMKNALANCADFIYLLAPLGKVFNKTTAEINTILRESKYPFATHKEYKTLTDKDAQLPQNSEKRYPETFNVPVQRLLPSSLLKSNSVFLVTTSRPARDAVAYSPFLVQYFETIYSGLKRDFGDKLISDAFLPETSSAQAICELNMYQDPVQALLNYEFPHPEIRSALELEIFHR